MSRELASTSLNVHGWVVGFGHPSACKNPRAGLTSGTLGAESAQATGAAHLRSRATLYRTAEFRGLWMFCIPETLGAAEDGATAAGRQSL